jgi:hypothetical protein
VHGYCRAIGAYEYGGATEKFCEKHFLNAKVRTRIRTSIRQARAANSEARNRS